MKNHSTPPIIRPAKAARKLVLAGVAVLASLGMPAVAQQPAPAGAAASQPRVQSADWIVAVVNNEVITRRELDDKMAAVGGQLKAQGTPLPAQKLLEKQVLERMINERAQLQLAKERGLSVDDPMLDRAMLKIAEQNKVSLQQMRDQIEREGTNYAKFREEIRDELTMQRLVEGEVIGRIQITDSEIDNFLASQAATPQGQQEYSIAHILIRIPENASAEQIGERRARADDVLRQLKSGGDFSKLAASYSDSADALKGGELGWRGRDRLPQLFIEAAAPLRQGDVSNVLRSANGFHIIKLIGKRAPSVMTANAPAAPAVQQTRARHILIKTNQVVTVADARRKLADIKTRIDAGASFEEMARLYSGDLSASKGGDLGWLYPGDTVPDFERAMDALKPGQVSDPVTSPFGVHLIQVVERKTEDVSKERQRTVARQALRDRKTDESVQDWMRQLRDRTYVENRLEEK